MAEYARELTGSALVGPMDQASYNEYANEMRNSKIIKFLTFQAPEGYYVANAVASTGDFKAIVIYFSGWHKWGYGQKRATTLPVCYYKLLLKFNTQGGTIAKTEMEKALDVTFKVSSNIPTKYKYVFAGWALEPNSENVKFDINATIPNSAFPTGRVPDGDIYAGDLKPQDIIGSGDLSLYAVWKQDTYDMLLDGEKGYVIQYGHPLPVITTKPTRKGYIFGGYYTSPNGGGTCYYNNELEPQLEWYDHDGPLSLFAKWIPIRYTIKFDRTAGQGTMNDIVNIEYDSTVVLPLNKFTRTGYVFKCWSFEPVELADGIAIKNLTHIDGSVLTLKALWTPLSYTVTYNMSEADVRNSIITENVVFDSVYTLLLNSSWKHGYRFLFWIDQDGITYKEGTKIVWKRTSPLTLKPVYEVSDGILVLEPAIIPAGQLTYSIMLYEPIKELILTNSNGNKISAYTYKHSDNILKITLNNLRTDNVTIEVNGSNLLWHKGLMYTCIEGTTWKRVDMYIANDNGEFVLSK